MALDFPSNPTEGQLFGIYIYSGGTWRVQGSTNNVGTQIAQLQAKQGKVLQVIQGSTLTSTSNSTTTFVDTSLTATITPKFASSKILVLVTQNGLYKSSSNASNAVWLQLVKGTDAILIFGYAIGLNTVAQTGYIGSASVNYLDSPNTISPVTYKTQFRNEAAASEVSVQRNNNATSTIILMEIAA